VIREDGIPTGGKSFNTRAQWIIENILKHNQSCTSQYPFRFAPTLLITPLTLRSAIIRSICRALISRPSAILVFRHLFRHKDSGYSDIIKTVSVLPPYISSYGNPATTPPRRRRGWQEQKSGALDHSSSNKSSRISSNDGLDTRGIGLISIPSAFQSIGS